MNPSVKRFLTLIAGCVGLACALGISIDLVTANVAVEYFTVHHPHVVDSQSPWVMALVWGVGAAWWAGAIEGVVLGAINHRRSQPLPPRRILKWGAVACVAIWLTMMTIMVGSYAVISIMVPLEKRPPDFDHNRLLMSVAMAHQLEYLLAAIAVLVIAIKTWRAK